MNKKRKILVAGMGTTPAVLTETIWALVHQSEPVVFCLPTSNRRFFYRPYLQCLGFSASQIDTLSFFYLL